MCSFYWSSFKQYFLSSLVQSVFIVFPYDFEQAKDQMANLGCLLVCAFGNFLAPVLVAAHTVNNLDLGDELENQGYEID